MASGQCPLQTNSLDLSPSVRARPAATLDVTQYAEYSCEISAAHVGFGNEQDALPNGCNSRAS